MKTDERMENEAGRGNVRTRERKKGDNVYEAEREIREEQNRSRDNK